MKQLLTFILFVVFASGMNAQTKKQLKQHRLKVEESRNNQTPLISLDTFYCAGKKSAVYRDSLFTDPNTGDSLIVVSCFTENNVLYTQYYFPALRSFCDMAYKTGDPDLFRVICKQGLLGNTGLDTFRAEAFVSIKGSHKKKKETDNTFKMAERDRSAKITVLEHDIYQDSIIIGSFEETTLPGPGGKSFRQIQVYNPQKRVVCFSTEINAEKHEWRTVTNKDGKYHSIISDQGKDGDLYHILRFLITSGYL